MTDTKNNRAAPKHGGTDKEHEGYRTKLKAWAIDQDDEMKTYNVLFGQSNPNDYARREQQVTIDTDDDLRGERGTVLSRQTQNQYDETLAAFNAKDLTVWAKTLQSLEGKALEEAMKAKPEESARAALAKMDAKYGKKTTMRISTLLVKFMEDKKPSATSISDHISTWETQFKNIDQNGGFDKRKMEVALFLKSLGPKYRDFTNLCCMYTETDFTLQNVMAKAADFQLSDENENARQIQGALMAQNTKTNKPKGQQNTNEGANCTGCGSKYHQHDECFNGGLSHLDREGRAAWLDHKRKERAMRRGEFGVESGRNGRRGGEYDRDRDRHRDRDRERGRGRDRQRNDRDRDRSRSRDRTGASAFLAAMSTKVNEQLRNAQAKGDFNFGYMADECEREIANKNRMDQHFEM